MERLILTGSRPSTQRQGPHHWRSGGDLDVEKMHNIGHHSAVLKVANQVFLVCKMSLGYPPFHLTWHIEFWDDLNVAVLGVLQDVSVLLDIR